jgi:hypothetical protein
MNGLDPALLTECEEAREGVQSAEDALSSARSAFETSVRRLYIEGASTREIAGALGLSHQRVHQLIGVEPKSWWHRVLGVRHEPLRGCSFCGRSAKDISKLVAGPSVHICDRCIDAAISALTEENNPDTSPLHRLPEASLKRCSFCGQRDRRNVRATAGGHQICGVCVAKAKAIVTASLA